MTKIIDTRKPFILYADDSLSDQELVSKCLIQSGEFGHVFLAANLEEAARILAGHHVEAAIIDLYLDPDEDMPLSKGHELLVDKRFSHVPKILVSGKREEMVYRVLKSYWGKREFEFLDKNIYFYGGESQQNRLAHAVTRFIRQNYNCDVEFETNDQGLDNSWETQARKFCTREAKEEDRVLAAHELEFLARKAFCNWDASSEDERTRTSLHAAKLKIVDVMESGRHSVVLQIMPISKQGNSQADVIAKITRDQKDVVAEHTKFETYKNIIGGCGLRERRYARSCNFHIQVYAVPYYRFSQTPTYYSFYSGAQNRTSDLRTIEHVTGRLFKNTLGHLVNRKPMPGNNTLTLSEYYAERIQLNRRAAAVQALLQDPPPGNIQCEVIRDEVGDTRLRVRLGDEIRLLNNPFHAVMQYRNYRSMLDQCNANLRHGDMHTLNVVVDKNSRSCWYFDYERFGEHYVLVDHTEFEANILFGLLSIQSSNLFARFITAITDTTSLSTLPEDASSCADEPYDDLSEVDHLRKALAAIHAIRDSIGGSLRDVNPVKNYYHALMYEALREAGKLQEHPSEDPNISLSRRWLALIAAALLFETIEAM